MIACIYTLDKWSAAKDILSIHELTGLSATLKSWYLLFFASLITMGTSCDLHIHVSQTHKNSATYGVILGLVSTCIALFFILVHYRLIDYEFLQVGGWIELSASFFMILVWVVGVSILTAEAGIAATIGGAGCRSRTEYDNGIDFGEGCFVIWVPVDEKNGGDKESAQPTQSTAPSVTPSQRKTVAPAGIESDSGTNLPQEAANVTTSPASLFPTQTPGNASTTTAPANASVTTAPESASPTEPQNATFAPSATTATTLTPSAASTTLAPSAATTIAATVTETLTEAPEDIVTTSPTGNPLSVLDISFVDVSANNNGTRRLQAAQNTSTSTPAEQNTTGNSSTSTPSPSSTDTTDVPSTRPTSYPSYLPSSLPSSFPTNFPTFLEYEHRMSCTDVIDQQIPGSNLYLAVWVCFLASFNVTLRWKAAQAIQFAQAQNKKAANLREEEQNDSENGDDDKEKDGDDDDDERDPGSSYPAEDGDL